MAGIALQDGEFTLETVVDGGDDDARATAALPGGGYVVLDTTRTPELEAEGLARDVVRAVQQARRDAGLDISDRIRLTVAADEAVWSAVVAHQHLVMTETLATQFGSSGDGRRPADRATACSRRRPATVCAVRVKVERQP